MLRLQTVTEGKSTESLCWSVVATSTGPLRYSLTCSVVVSVQLQLQFAVELQTVVHTKVRNHGEGPY